MEKAKKITVTVLAMLGGFITWLVTVFPTETHDWLLRSGPTVLANTWPVFRAVFFALPFVALVWTFLAVRGLRRRVDAIHDWLYSRGNTAFSIAFAKRQINQPQGTPSLRDLVGIMAEWEHNGRRFPDEPKT